MIVSGCDPVDLIMALAVFLLALAVQERLHHQKNLHRIPVRINVSGTRGKSTVTRLVAAALAEGGYLTVGKTTGSSPRLFQGPGLQEENIVRNPEGANINEQKRVVRYAAGIGAHALVSECMAVDPEYQEVIQKQWLQAQIGIITNVLPDHLEEMGPTLADVAEALAAAIPIKGIAVAAPGPFQEYFAQVAAERSTKLVIADPESVSSHYLDQFDYILFPENVAIALAAAQSLGIDRRTALRGMLKARPDPGALNVLPVGMGKRRTTYFANAFSANDPASTLAIWDHIRQLGYARNKVLVIMNCRGDRIPRTVQFARDVLPHLPIQTLVLTGKGCEPVMGAHDAGLFSAEHMVHWESRSDDSLKEVLKQEVKDHEFILGIGNLCGAGARIALIMEELAREHEDWRKRQGSGRLKTAGERLPI